MSNKKIEEIPESDSETDNFKKLEGMRESIEHRMKILLAKPDKSDSELKEINDRKYLLNLNDENLSDELEKRSALMKNRRKEKRASIERRIKELLDKPDKSFKKNEELLSLQNLLESEDFCESLGQQPDTKVAWDSKPPEDCNINIVGVEKLFPELL